MRNVACRVLAIALLALGVLAAVPAPALAVALRPNKATDDSVCDLGHDTNAYLGSKLLIPSAAAVKDQADAYFRLASAFIATNCANGQLLILQGSATSEIDGRSLTTVANSACAVASVVRSEVTMSLAGRARPGFELRCTVLKHAELVTKLNELERVDPMDALKARMYAALDEAERGSRPGAAAAGSEKKDCGKITLASLLQGGSCK